MYDDYFSPFLSGTTEGWLCLKEGNKYHWFENNKSLCGKFRSLKDAVYQIDPEGLSATYDDCELCSRVMKKESA